VDVVASIPEDRDVLFCPDQFLGAHVRRVTGRTNLHIWAGECHVHAGINGDELAAQARSHPDAELYIHPECGCATSALYLAGEGAFPEERVKILSTGGMLDAARESNAWWPPKSACCTSCARPHRVSTSRPSTTAPRAST
jgi:quinolinate synthase